MFGSSSFLGLLKFSESLVKLIKATMTDAAWPYLTLSPCSSMFTKQKRETNSAGVADADFSNNY